MSKHEGSENDRERHGFSVIRVLPDLEGKPWNEVTRAYLRAQRPSDVRVIEGGVVKNNAMLWRVTVYLTADKRIERIDQEVEVDLPDDVAHGHDLNMRLARL